MDEKKLLEGFAKALGSAGEKALKDIEEKKLKEQKYLEGLASMLGPEAKRKLEEIENEQAEKKKALEAKKEEIRAKKEKEQRLLDEINKSLTALVTGNPQYIEAIEQEVAETIAELPIEETIAAAVEETVAEVIEEAPVEEIEENAAQPQPELPKDDIITLAVKDISKSAPGKIQDVVDELPRGLRRELDILKKSIADLHRFATNHSQMGGGGEVKLARLDDVDASTIEDGYYLQYDAASGKFIFAAGGGGGGTGPRGANGISITNAAVNGNGYLIITYSNSATSNAGYVVGATGPTGANGANGAAGANGANGTNGTNGTDGIGISSATVNGDGYLTITYSNTYVANAGYVVGPAGSGNGGVSQIQSNWTQTNNTAVDFIKNKPYVPTNTDIETAYNNVVAYAASNTYVNSTFATNTYVNGTFQTMSGLSANVATLAANAATYLNGKTESNLNVNNALTSNNSTYAFGKSESALNVNNALTSNNSSYLGGVAANGYLTTTGVNTSNGSFTYYSNASNTAFSIVLTPYTPTGNQTFAFYTTGSIYGPQAWMSWPDGTLQRTAWTGAADGLIANSSGTFVNNSYIATLSANASTYLNGKTESNLNVNNALTSNNASYLGGNTASDLRTYASDLAGNAYSNAIAYAASNSTVYSTFATNTYVNSTFQTMAGLSANVATLAANASTYLNGKTESNLNVNNSFTSNNASYLGGNTALDLRAYSDTAAGIAYSNAISYAASNNAVYSTFATNTYVNSTFATNTYVNSTFATNTYVNDTFQTMAGLSANVAKLSANAATYLNGKTEPNLNVNNALTSNNASYLNGNTASDILTYVDNKSGNAYTNATAFSSNASNISSGTVGEPRLPYRMDQNVRTTDAVSFGNMTITGNLTVTGNVAVIGANNLTVVDNMIYLNSNNTVTNPDLGFAGNYNDGSYHHAGFFRDATDGFWKVFDNYAPEPDASPYIDTSNNTFHIADFHANTFRVGNTTVYSTINSTAFSGSANSASYLGGNTASDLRTYTDNKSGNAFSNAVSTMIANSTSYTGNNTFGGTTTTFNSNIVFNGTFTIDGGTF